MKKHPSSKTQQTLTFFTTKFVLKRDRTKSPIRDRMLCVRFTEEDVYRRFVEHNYVLSLIHCHRICVYIVFTVKGQCPDYALGRASSVFFPSKGNRTVMLTRQDFLPDSPPTEICCLYSQVIFQTFEEVFDSRHEDSSRFYR